MPQLNFNALVSGGPQSVYEGFMQGQEIRNKLAQQEQARQLTDIQRQHATLQLQNATREQQAADEEAAAWKAGAGDPKVVLQQLQQRGLGKSAMALQGQLTKQQTDKLAQQKTMVDLVKHSANQVFANPGSALQILQSFGQRTGVDMSDDIAEVQRLGGDLEAVKHWAAGKAVEADKLLPKFQHFGVPGVGVQTGSVDPITNKFTPGVLHKASDVLSPEAEAQKKRVAVAGRSVNNTVVKLPEQEKAFESELGKKQAGRVIDSKAAAEDAAQIMRTNQIGRDILASGAITGTGANFLVGLNNALQQAGIDAGFEDAAANSQAYAAAMGANVGRIIKQFGAGTGLSDADRQYAEQMAGGKINLTEKALKRILDINDRAAGAVIDAHNKDVAQIKTNIPLTVTRPPSGGRAAPSPAANQIPAGRTVAPAAAAKTVTRTGVSNGRKVVQYSDGSIEYAN